MPSHPKDIMRYRDDSKSDLEDKASLLSHDGDTDYEVATRTAPTVLSLLILALLVVSLAGNVFTWTLLSKVRQVTQPVPDPGFDSPALRDLGSQFYDHYINGSFEEVSIYRQKPSQEVDDAWLALGTDFGSIVVPYEDGKAYGLKEGQVKRVDEQGGGYLADLYIFHNLHCLNLIRQTSHFQWDYYRAMAYTDKAPGTAFEQFDGEEQLEMHFTHCIDMIRQELMCDANLAVFGQWFVAVPDKPSKPTKDFSYTRKCRNFDAVKDWWGANHIDMGTTMVRHQPGDPVWTHDP